MIPITSGNNCLSLSGGGTHDQDDPLSGAMMEMKKENFGFQNFFLETQRTTAAPARERTAIPAPSGALVVGVGVGFRVA
jgi:hypothetical protein